MAWQLLIPAAVGAGAGYLQNREKQKQREEDLQRNADIIENSVLTSPQGTVDETNPGSMTGDILSGAGAGASLGQNASEAGIWEGLFEQQNPNSQAQNIGNLDPIEATSKTQGAPLQQNQYQRNLNRGDLQLRQNQNRNRVRSYA